MGHVATFERFATFCDLSHAGGACGRTADGRDGAGPGGAREPGCGAGAAGAARGRARRTRPAPGVSKHARVGRIAQRVAAGERGGA
jgi:hypothetical protein